MIFIEVRIPEAFFYKSKIELLITYPITLLELHHSQLSSQSRWLTDITTDNHRLPPPANNNQNCPSGELYTSVPIIFASTRSKTDAARMQKFQPWHHYIRKLIWKLNQVHHQHHRLIAPPSGIFERLPSTPEYRSLNIPQPSEGAKVEKIVFKLTLCIHYLHQYFPHMILLGKILTY